MKSNLTRSTRFRSLSYRSGWLYNIFTKCLYDKRKKFSTIARLVGKNKRILDLPCGTGYLARFLRASTEYEGWDLNHRFLKKFIMDYKRRRFSLKKFILKQRNIFNFNQYPEPKKDVIVLCDIIHHINGRKEELIENAKNFADKIITCEPLAIRPTEMTANSKGFNLFLKIAKFFPERLIKWIDILFADNDGLSSYEQRASWHYDEDSLKNFYNKLGIKKESIYRVSDDFIGVITVKH